MGNGMVRTEFLGAQFLFPGVQAQAGILTEAQSAPVPRVKKEAAVSTMRNWYSNNNRLVSASSSADIRTGDLAFFNSHVGIVVGVSGNTINLVEGNCGKYVRKYAYTNFNGRLLERFSILAVIMTSLHIPQNRASIL